MRLGRQLADHLGLEPGMLWVRVAPEPLRTRHCPRGAAWSARHPVTVEAMGSNPIGDAFECGMQNSDCRLNVTDSAFRNPKSEIDLAP